jgi:hypothetical protein
MLKDQIIKFFETHKSYREIHLKTKHTELHDLVNKHELFETKTIYEKMYCIAHEIVDIPLCPICKTRLKFCGYNTGYQTYCSRACLNKSENHKNGIKQALKNKYGENITSVSQLE